MDAQLNSDRSSVKEKHRRDIGGIFIPAGIFIGMGVGFLVNNLVAGLFIGMGCGFAAFAITMIAKRS